MKMNIASLLKAHAGQESAEVEVAPVQMSPEEVQQLAEQVVEQKVENELSELEGDVEDLMEKQAKHDEVIEELEEVVEGMEYLIKQPKVNGKALTVLYHQADRLHTKLGKPSTLNVQGTESLNARTIEAHAIVGCESFVETIKSAAKNTGAFLKKVWEGVIAYIKQQLTDTGRIEKRAKDLMTKLVSGAELKEEVKPGDWAAFIAYFSRRSKFVDVLNNMTSIISLVQNGTKEQGLKVAQLLHSYCEDIRKAVDSSQVKKSGDVFTVVIDEGAEMSYLDVDAKDQEQAVKFLSKLTFKPRAVVLPKNANNLSAGDRRHLIEVCDRAIENAKDIEKVRKVSEDNFKAMDKAVEGADKETQRINRQVNQVVARITMFVVKMRVKSAKAGCDMVAAYIK